MRALYSKGFFSERLEQHSQVCFYPLSIAMSNFSSKSFASSFITFPNSVKTLKKAEQYVVLFYSYIFRHILKMGFSEGSMRRRPFLICCCLD